MSGPQLPWRPILDISSLSPYDPSHSRAVSPAPRQSIKSRPSRIAGSGPTVAHPIPDALNVVSKLPALPALDEHPDMPPSVVPMIPSPRSSMPPPSVPMTPSSSLGLPSPTFPPRKLPPIPPRSPARPQPADFPSAPSSRRNSLQVSVRLASSRAQQARAFTPLNEDILSEGDVLGEGIVLRGETIRAVPVTTLSSFRDPCQLSSAKFEVFRKLGTGSYAVVFLVREIISGYESPSAHQDIPFGDFDFAPRSSRVYGREFAIKCLSKANLSPTELQVQMVEATIHQSLNLHHNIVTLHRTLETDSYLLLVLEYVPGEDLFYFLEQSRDNGDLASQDAVASQQSTFTNTPPTPSLLSSLHPGQLLSRGRLRLIASMFSQMCEAVQACHEQGVSHRDIKPENFIVTDGQGRGADGKLERRVIVKLSDFGLATKDRYSSDMDCGSAPYMSYECRNNVGPTYATQSADIWSLGIVLINMLYHHNLWSDPCIGNDVFDQYRAQPVAFLMQRSPGMTYEVANFLANRVFCLLPTHDQEGVRVTAREFGYWARSLPHAMGEPTHISPLVSSLPDLDPAPRLSHSPGCRHGHDDEYDEDEDEDPSSSGPNIILDDLVQCSSEHNSRIGEHIVCDACSAAAEDSTRTRRRKRGARRGKGGHSLPSTPSAISSSPIMTSAPLASFGLSSPAPADVDADNRLEDLAQGAQVLAREISRVSASKKSSLLNSHPRSASRSWSRRRAQGDEDSNDIPPLPPLTNPAIIKKPSMWNVFSRKDVSDTLSPTNQAIAAQNVSSIIKALGPSGNDTQKPPPVPEANSTASINSTSSIDSETGAGAWRGRRLEAHRGPVDHTTSPVRGRNNWDRSPAPSTLSNFTIRSSATTNANWRQPPPPSVTSSSASSTFTRFSNSSERSVSTFATSISASSNFNIGGSAGVLQADKKLQVQTPNIPAPPKITKAARPPPRPLPPNVKNMAGMPWELDELPRQLRPPVNGQTLPGDIFGGPPVRRRKQQPKPALDTITERPKTAIPPRRPTSPVTSNGGGSDSDAENDHQSGRVRKGQINALAKMLSALKTSRGRE